MRTAVLVRDTTSDAGTFGRLTLDDGTKYYTGELPWRSNQPKISSIPAGVYLCKWELSPKHGWCYWVTGVPGRGEIEIHSANWCGDKSLPNPATKQPYQCQLEGCIALGFSLGELEQQMAVLRSKDAIADFNEKLNRAPLQLIVHDIPTPAVDVTGEISM